MGHDVSSTPEMEAQIAPLPVKSWDMHTLI
jgi:hypothetical protein